MNRIACVVVTYNRLNLLKQCVEALYRQTYKDFDLIVVNNGSTDGTDEWLKSINDIDILSQSNLGGSGGFHNGIQYAYNKGYDYFWVMDDDGVPDRNCLEKLIVVAESGFHYVAPMLYTNDKRCHWSYLVNINRKILSHGGGPFNAILLSKELIECVGLPNIYYFIWGDEFEFLNRVRESFFHTALVKDAIHYHKIPEDKNAVDKRIYFKIRNMIWSIRLSNGMFRSRFNLGCSALLAFFRYFLNYISRLKFKTIYQLIKGVKDGLTMNLEILKEGSKLQR